MEHKKKANQTKTNQQKLKEANKKQQREFFANRNF